MDHSLHKAERLNKKKIIEKMFAGGARSFSLFPLRVVYLPIEGLDAPVSILASVPKRHLKRAVHRNRVKRQIREAYRLHKQPLLQALEGQPRQMAIAFIYLDKQLCPSAVMADRVRTAVMRIAEKVAAHP